MLPKQSEPIEPVSEGSGRDSEGTWELVGMKTDTSTGTTDRVWS